MAYKGVPATSLELMQEIRHRVPEIEIREEQIEALDALDANEQDGNTAGLIAMAPGIGKTIVMAADTRRHWLGQTNTKRVALLVYLRTSLLWAEC